MELREAAFPVDDPGSGYAVRALRARWRTASLAAGWSFPGDWALPEIDAVCSTALSGGDLTGALTALGRARADAGIGLGETLADLAALHAVLVNPESDELAIADPDATPSGLLRSMALAWADVTVGKIAVSDVSDSLTGLVTPAYLRTRLAEVYREAEFCGRAAGQRYVLLTAGLDLSAVNGWSKLAAKVLLADVLRSVFRGGETIATLGPSLDAVLFCKHERMAALVAGLRWMCAEKLAADPHLADVHAPNVRLHPLPATYPEACRLLTDLASGIA